jgi:hypothetical protein
MLQRIIKRRAIHRYLTLLPGLLQRDYGRASLGAPYTPAQVQKTIERNGLSRAYLTYAIAVFAEQSGFDAFQAQAGVRESYAAVRSEIAATYFNGNLNFSVYDVCGHGSMDNCAGSAHEGGGGHHGGSADGQ